MNKIIKEAGIITLYSFLSIGFGYSQEHADAGRDTTILKGTKVTIGPTEYKDTWCFSWSADSMHTLSDKKAPQPEVNPSVTSTYKLQVVGPDFEFTDKDEVVVTVKDIEVNFRKATDQNFGFDNYGANKKIPWKSTQSGELDGFWAIIKPVEEYSNVYFKSVDPSFQITPEVAGSDEQSVIIKPSTIGNTELHARLESTSGTSINKINIASYNLITYNVELISVVDQNDDKQEIPLGKGSPYDVAIKAGTDNVLQSVKGGDDIEVSNQINTGENGICETNALGDDLPVIPIGQGKSNTICVTRGPNNFWDTKQAGVTDVKEPDVIRTGPDGICNTNASDTNSTINNINYSNFSPTLNSIYKQAVFSWNVSILPGCITNYDLNNNSMVDYGEMDTIIKYCAPYTTANTKVIFLVNRGSTPDQLGYTIDFNQPYVFIYTNYISGIFTVMAHELGHSLNLRHTIEVLDLEAHPDPKDERQDKNNLMHPYPTNTLLRKNQWDLLHP